MNDQPSLFARRLRSWRSQNGRHGRMTQEQLASTLDISVDAIGKYERSVSFIRGDLEHRLIEKLGWKPADVRECRADWEARNSRRTPSAYRRLDSQAVKEKFGGSWNTAIVAMIKTAEREFGRLPDEFAASQAVYLPLYDACPEHWAAILHDTEIVAKWALPFLLPEDEDRFKKGEFIETELCPERLHRAVLPGTYFGYCTAVIVKGGHEAAANMLLSSFISFLEDLAGRDILLHGIGTVSCSAGGAQMCRDLGMIHLGKHRICQDYDMWELPGHAISGSLFGRRSPILRARYAETFKN